jgi:predicted transcriptional regulator
MIQGTACTPLYKQKEEEIKKILYKCGINNVVFSERLGTLEDLLKETNKNNQSFK